jgi:FlaG/FlaF family flagellin (archaellin)
MSSHKNTFRNDTNAVSGVIGEVLVTAIAVLAFSVIAVFVFSYADSQEKVYADIQGWMDVDSDTVRLRHAGGQTIDFGIDADSLGKVRLIASHVNLTRTINRSQVNDGQWHHVVAVYSQSNSRTLYVDGMNRESDNSGTQFNSAIDRWTFGRWGDSTPSNYFNGSIDEVRIWNRTLNSTEVQQLNLNL